MPAEKTEKCRENKHICKEGNNTWGQNYKEESAFSADRTEGMKA